MKFNGVLCGRATWKEGIPMYAKQGRRHSGNGCETEGVKNINNVNSELKAATSWHPIYGLEPARSELISRVESWTTNVKGAASHAQWAHLHFSLLQLKGIIQGLLTTRVVSRLSRERAGTPAVPAISV